VLRRGSDEIIPIMPSAENIYSSVDAPFLINCVKYKLEDRDCFLIYAAKKTPSSTQD
jgi:hypothetical protein